MRLQARSRGNSGDLITRRSRVRIPPPLFRKAALPSRVRCHEPSRDACDSSGEHLASCALHDRRRKGGDGPQTLYGSDDRKFACNQAPSRSPHQLESARLPVCCPTTQTHYPAARVKKTYECRASSKRLKGFEPSTFCMARRTRGRGVDHKLPTNWGLFQPATRR